MEEFNFKSANYYRIWATLCWFSALVLFGLIMYKLFIDKGELSGWLIAQMAVLFAIIVHIIYRAVINDKLIRLVLEYNQFKDDMYNIEHEMFQSKYIFINTSKLLDKYGEWMLSNWSILHNELEEE